MEKKKVVDIDFEPVTPPPDWTKDEKPHVVKRPLISINLSSTASKTFGQFVMVSLIVAAIESLLYMFIAGLASAPGVIGVKMVEQVDRDDFGNPLTFYPWLLIICAAVYIIAISMWWHNRD